MKNIKILFVEDEKLLRTLFEDSVAALGDQYAGCSFDMSAVSDLKSAIAYLDEKPAPDVVILDLRLPRGESQETVEAPEQENGFMILKYVKSREKFNCTPVIVFTNLGDQETERKAKELKADKFLIKSEVLPSRLLNTITDLVK